MSSERSAMTTDREYDDSPVGEPQHVVLGQLTSPYGTKGWLKVYSYTSPMDGILDYSQWLLRQGESIAAWRVVEGRRQGKGLVACLDGVNRREQAEQLAGAEILLPTESLPALASGEYYWYQLEGLEVITREGVALGRVDYLLETGANDVLVVKNPGGTERLLPFLPEQVVIDVDLNAKRMTVDWDPDF